MRPSRARKRPVQSVFLLLLALAGRFPVLSLPEIFSLLLYSRMGEKKVTCSTHHSFIHHRWFLLIWNAVVASTSFAIVILIVIPIQMTPMQSREARCDSKTKPWCVEDSSSMEPLTKSIQLRGARNYYDSPAVSNLNATKEEINEFLGLDSSMEESDMISDRFAAVAQCRMTVNYRRATKTKGDETIEDAATCNRVYAMWAIVVLCIAVLSLAEFAFGIALDKFPTELSYDEKRFRCRGCQAFVTMCLWIVAVSYYATRREDVGLWYVRFGSIVQSAYYEEPGRWMAIGVLAMINLGWKIAEIFLCCCSFYPSMIDTDEDAEKGGRGGGKNRELSETDESSTQRGGDDGGMSFLEKQIGWIPSDSTRSGRDESKSEGMIGGRKKQQQQIDGKTAKKKSSGGWLQQPLCFSTSPAAEKVAQIALPPPPPPPSVSPAPRSVIRSKKPQSPPPPPPPTAPVKSSLKSFAREPSISASLKTPDLRMSEPKSQLKSLTTASKSGSPTSYVSKRAMTTAVVKAKGGTPSKSIPKKK